MDSLVDDIPRVSKRRSHCDGRQGPPAAETAAATPAPRQSRAAVSFLVQGTWCIQHQHSSMAVTVKSLSWMGFVFYHMPHTPYYGHVYVGNGLKNSDLIFMLPN